MKVKELSQLANRLGYPFIACQANGTWEMYKVKPELKTETNIPPFITTIEWQVANNSDVAVVLGDRPKPAKDFTKSLLAYEQPAERAKDAEGVEPQESANARQACANAAAFLGFEYIAMDADGEWFAYNKPPTAIVGAWNNAPHSTFFHIRNKPPTTIPWNLSLTKGVISGPL